MGDNKYRLVSQVVLNEIERKKSLLEKNPEYHLHLSKKKRRSLQVEAAKHSVSLELEGYNTSTTYHSRMKAKENNRCQKDILCAMEWGLEFYNGGIDLDFLEEIGRKVDYESNSEGFRKGKVRIKGARVTPPSPEKLERELNSFVLENSQIEHTIGQAVHAHLHLARIHPFNDGNGRVSRLVQNIILENGGFFPITVSPKDRDEYINLIDNAVYSYHYAEGTLLEARNFFEAKQRYIEKDLLEKDKKFLEEYILAQSRKLLTSPQNEFYDFLALKIRDFLQEEQEKLFKNSRKSKKSKK